MACFGWASLEWGFDRFLAGLGVPDQFQACFKSSWSRDLAARHAECLDQEGFEAGANHPPFLVALPLKTHNFGVGPGYCAKCREVVVNTLCPLDFCLVGLSPTDGLWPHTPTTQPPPASARWRAKVWRTCRGSWRRMGATLPSMDMDGMFEVLTTSSI